MEVDLNDIELLVTVDHQAEAALKLLTAIATDYAPATLACGLGVEGMVLTDIIMRNQLPIEIFSLDTGRLTTETYDLIQRLRRHYGLTLKLFSRATTWSNRSCAHMASTASTSRWNSARPAAMRARSSRCNAPWRAIKPGSPACAPSNRRARAELPVQLYDTANGLEKFNPLAGWTEAEVWTYIKTRNVPYNRLHDKGYPASVARPAHAPSRRVSMCAPAAGGGKTPPARSAAFT